MTPADRGAELAERVRAGDRRTLARLLTEVEGRTTLAESALRILYPLTGGAHLVGVTGAPGAGKSTLVAALAGAVRASGRPVAVLAIDPSSPITGGAILGDRIRMQEHAGDRDVFIRSMASRGHPGGLAAAAVDAAAALDAAGFPIVFLETVGAGQSEVEVASIADTTVVVEAPDMGDEVQAIKAGLLEVADIVVVTKGDRPGAQRTAAQLRAMLTVGTADEAEAARQAAARGRRRPKRPQVLLVTAPTGEGIPDLLEALDRRGAGRDSQALRPARLARAAAQLDAVMAERLRGRVRAVRHRAEIDALLHAIAGHEVDPYAAADRVIALLDGEAPPGDPEAPPVQYASAP
ncbi:MAG TPA: methylmalonyl Co-A mutase-associated GTPase MeaB [Candidatus Acidoferrales bacterium]|nr:methylmalonyl Co-A mutase-associated GTPase MeaB [Candidatus Acidoferrales bacterium]